ncbi:MAG TPA: MFS transporter [Streptosporangiaceae bacterium]
MTNSVATGEENRRARRAAVGAMAGTSLEFYDFYVYATASALVFGKVFFPETGNPFIGTLASFGVFGVGFVARPIGGVIFGHFGDRLGRKKALIVSLLLMGGATFAVGFVPSYASIGLGAPLILVVLRLIQGFAIGGEWGGAALISTESAPSGKVNFFGAFTQMGSPAGTVLSSGMFALVGLGGQDALAAWAWRVPFWFAGVLVVVGLVLRLKLEESPVFTAAVRAHEERKVPVVRVLRDEWRTVLAGTCLVAIGIGGFYVTGTLFLSYATDTLKLAESPLLLGQTIAAATSFVTFPLWAAWADRSGAPRVMVVAVVGSVLTALPHFLVAGGGNFLLIAIMLCVTQTAQGGAWVCIPAFLSKAFNVTTRYTGMSLAYQIAAILFGGVLPIVGAAFLAATGGGYGGPVAILFGLSALTAIGVFATNRIVKRGVPQ